MLQKIFLTSWRLHQIMNQRLLSKKQRWRKLAWSISWRCVSKIQWRIQTSIQTLLLRYWNQDSEMYIYLTNLHSRDENDIERISWFKAKSTNQEERKSPNESESERNHRILYTIWKRRTKGSGIQRRITSERFYFKICWWWTRRIEWCWSDFQRKKLHDLKTNIFQR